MKHKIEADGYAYRLRPVSLVDASFIVALRLADSERNQFINPIKPDISAQEEWIEHYFTRVGDYYFVVENTLTGKPEGLIAIYDVAGSRAEWGRWVLQSGSLAALESVTLLFQIGFEQLGLSELYCRTVIDNKSVVGFHDRLPQMRRDQSSPLIITLGSRKYTTVEHYVTRKYYNEHLHGKLVEKCRKVFQRNFRLLLSTLEFHHLGIATNNLEEDYKAYHLLGYNLEGSVFEDEIQGVRGQFITAEGQPRLELLENLACRTTLNIWLKNHTKIYHCAYRVEQFDKVVETCHRNRIKVVSEKKISAYFGTQICFLMLPNMQLIELIEKKHD